MMIFITVIFLFYFLNKPIITAKGKGNEGEIEPKPIYSHKKTITFTFFFKYIYGFKMSYPHVQIFIIDYLFFLNTFGIK